MDVKQNRLESTEIGALTPKKLNVAQSWPEPFRRFVAKI